MLRFHFAVATLIGAGLFSASGCSEKPKMAPAEMAKYRTALLLEEEPDGAQTILELREVMFGEKPAAHDDHDHDGDGVQDHAAEDHDHAAEGADHDHDGDGAADHAAADHADHDHDGDGTADHAAADHDHAAEEEHADHDHDGDGKADHDAADHDHADHDHADHDHADHDHAGHDHAHESKAPLVEEMDVVLVGSVGGVPNPSEQSSPEFPFAKGQAIFFLVDPEVAAEAEAHAHTHAPGEECAFCAAHAGDAAHAIAVVQFSDKGKALPVDTRDLFELKEKETVVVKGKAKATSNGMITVDADGLYIRR